MNKDLMKVIAGLECCISGDEKQGCDICAYKGFGPCIDILMADALAILREVEQDGLY